MWQRPKLNWKWYAGAAVVLAALVATACWYLWAPAPKKPEVYKPEVKQSDGSVVLEKKPDATAKPKQMIPPGAKVERLASVTVQPMATAPAQDAPAPTVQGGTAPPVGAPVVVPPATHCPPVTVDLSLIRLPDQTRRVIASSPDGQVIGGVDVPVEDAAPAPAPKVWAAGIAADPLRRTGGIWLDRDLGPFRLGVQVNQRELGGLPVQGWVKAGIRW